MATKTEPPRTIRATIAEDAISKVASFFDASITDIINELLQNARRAGAHRVDITWSPDDSTITLTDDGAGIADPQAILSFGGSNWNQEAVDRERPAGMGFYSVARRPHVRVVSKQAHSDAWAVTLTPEHFSGLESAEVQPADLPRRRLQGTAVSFAHTHDPGEAIRKAALFYPELVLYNGERQEREDFLAGALTITEWCGLRIGVHQRQTNWHYPNSHGRSINFHGIEVSGFDHLPEVATIGLHMEGFVSRVDVIDCPHLELTLPARKSLVETPFLEDLRQRCLLAIYETIASSPDPVDLAHSIKTDAMNRGISIPDARARLKPWNIRTDWKDSPDYDDPPRQDLPENALIVQCSLYQPMEHTLARAARRNGIAERLMQSEGHNMSGYDWYDALPVIFDIRAEVHHGDQTTELWTLDDEEDTPTAIPGRPDRIEVILEVRAPNGMVRQIRLETDFALPDSEQEYIDELNPLVTAESDMDANELSNIMMSAYFNPSQDYDSDSYDTQEADAKRATDEVATCTLHSQEEALSQNVRLALSHAGITSLPEGSTITATVGPRRSFEVHIQRFNGDGA